MEAASEHKAMGHLPDDDEHPHQKAFLTGEKNKYPAPQKSCFTLWLRFGFSTE